MARATINLIDPMFVQGIVFNSGTGIHLCGGVGGFEADQTSVIGNGTNVLIDRACAAKANTQMFFGTAFVSDTTAASPGIGVHVSDPGAPNWILIYKGWLASATNQCFVFDTGTPDNPTFPPAVNFIGAVIGNCHAPAGSHGTSIENQSAYAQIGILGARFFTNQPGRPTIFNVGGAPEMRIQGIIPGDVNFNISGAWNGILQSGGGSVRLNAPTGAGVTMGPNGGCGLWLTTGLFIPGSTDGATAGCPLTLGNGTYPFSAVNATTFQSGFALGFSGTKTAGACVMTITGGIITNVTGC